MVRSRLCLLALVGLFVAPLPAAAGAAHGTVLAWGCGVDPYLACMVPASAGSDVQAIAASAFDSLALKRDGSVVAWGCGVGDSVTRGQCNPPVAARSGVTAIAAGVWHSLAIKDGGVLAWGCAPFMGQPFEDFGQCTVPATAASGVTAIAASYYQSLALKNGTVLAWGCSGIFARDFGQCTVPAAAMNGVTAIAAAYTHNLALKDGSVIAWGCGGDSDHGQCTVPAAAATSVTAVAAGYSHSLALKNGGVIAWGCAGDSDHGQCTVPTAAASGVTAIAAGVWHSLALKKDGSVIAWGCASRSDPGQCTVPAAAGNGITAIAAGTHSLALFDPLEQTITVTGHAPASATYKQSFTVAASSSSGLPTAFASSGSCSNAGATFTMTSGTGTCLVKYDQTGGGVYEAAPQVVESVAAQKADQTISFGVLQKKTYGDGDFAVSASASSDLPVSFIARGNCTINGAIVHLTGAGSCTVTARQPGDTNYNAAPGVARTFAIARTPCTVPQVLGRKLRTAKAMLARRHCRPGKVGYASSGKRTGVVISQSRRAGRILPAESKIDLVVSRGRKR